MVYGYDSFLAAISIGSTEGHPAVHREYLLLPWMFMLATILFGQASGNPQERGTENGLLRIEDVPACGAGAGFFSSLSPAQVGQVMSRL